MALKTVVLCLCLSLVVAVHENSSDEEGVVITADNSVRARGLITSLLGGSDSSQAHYQEYRPSPCQAYEMMWRSLETRVGTEATALNDARTRLAVCNTNLNACFATLIAAG